MKRFVPSASLLVTTDVLAHTGHGNSGNGLLHYLSEPLHLIALLAGVAGVVGILATLRHMRRWQQ